MSLSLGQRLKKLRLDKGLTQQELGKLIGVAQSLIWRWESGKIKRLTDENVEKLAKLYGVSEAYITTGINVGDLPPEVEEWLHNPLNREKVLDFYRTAKLEEVEGNLNKLK